MPTVSTYLKIMDQFSQPLRRVSNGVQTAIAAIERLKRVMATPVATNFDTSKVVEAKNQTKEQLASIGGTSAIQLAIDEQVITQEFNDIRQRLQSRLSSAVIKVGIDAQSALQEFSTVCNPIDSTLDIEVALNIQNIISEITDVKEHILAELSQAIVHVTLDKQQALAKVANLRMEINDKLMKIKIKPIMKLPQAKKINILLSRLFERVASAVTVKLEFEPNAAYEQIYKITREMESIPIQFNVTLASTATELIRQQIVSIGSSTILELSVQLDMEKTISVINDICDKIKEGGTSVIELALNVQDIMGTVSDLDQRINSELSGVLVHITLDEQQALLDAASIRMDVIHVFGQIGIKLVTELPQAQELNGRLTSILQSLYPVIIVNLEFDQTIGQTKIQRLISQLGITSIALAVTLDANRAIAEVERLKQRISSCVFLAVCVILDTESVIKVFRQIQQRMRSGAERFMLSVSFNAREAIKKAQILKGLLEKQMDSIRAKIQVDLPSNLNVTFGNLQKPIFEPTAATRRTPHVGSNQSIVYQKVIISQQRILSLQNQINARTNQTIQSTSDLAGQLNGIEASYLFLQGMKNLFNVTIGKSFEQEKLKDMFVVRTGNVEIGKGMFEKFKADALAAGQDVNKSLQSTLSFFSVTQNVDHLTGLNNLITRLSAFDSTGDGIEGAASALKEAMNGDIVSLADRFGISIPDIQMLGIDKLGKTGDIEGFIKAFELLLEKQRLGKDAFDQMMASPTKQAEILGNNIKSALADAGTGATKSLFPFIKMMNNAFKTGKFQPFFDGLSTGLRVVAEIAAWAGNLIMDNLNIVQNLLVIIGIVALAMGINFLIAWIMAAWPILLIIGLITGLISLLNYFGISTSEIIGHIVGTFFLLAAYIWNRIAYIWNIFSIFAEFLGNLFIDPIYAIQKLFYDLAMEFGGQVYNMLRFAETFAGGFMKLIIQAINGVLKGFNWLSNKVKDLFGIDMGQATLFDEDNVHAMSDAVQDLLNKIDKPTSNKDVLDFSGTKLDTLDYTDMFNKGFSLGSGAIDDLTDTLDKATDFTDWNKQADLAKGAGELDKVGKVGQLDKIKESVDISSEDLKMMRELAEMKNIQNFVTLQPSISFGDTHVQHENDLNTIVVKITQKLNEDIATSVDAVYS